MRCMVLSRFIFSVWVRTGQADELQDFTFSGSLGGFLAKKLACRRLLSVLLYYLCIKRKIQYRAQFAAEHASQTLEGGSSPRSWVSFYETDMTD